jgi:DNA-binding NarL/FixJ family response regulator
MIKVFIADDDTLVANVIADKCKALGWETMISNGTAGILMNIKKYNPDVIFLDILIPGKTGLDIVDDMKKDMPEFLPRTIIITSLDNQTYLAEAMEKGVIHYTTKNSENPDHIIDIAKKIVGDRS